MPSAAAAAAAAALQTNRVFFRCWVAFSLSLYIYLFLTLCFAVSSSRLFSFISLSLCYPLLRTSFCRVAPPCSRTLVFAWAATFKRLTDRRHEYNQKLVGDSIQLKPMAVNVVTHEMQRFAVWFGGSMVACLVSETTSTFLLAGCLPAAPLLSAAPFCPFCLLLLLMCCCCCLSACCCYCCFPFTAVVVVVDDALVYWRVLSFFFAPPWGHR